MLYVVILLVKIFEVSLATFRLVLITKGERLKGALVSFFEVSIWLILASWVLKDVTSDPLKAVMYALGFSIGNYMGCILEEKIGIGTIKIEMIVKEEHAEEILPALRSAGFAVTVVSAEGMNHGRKILISHIKRRKVAQYIEIAKAKQKNLVITTSEVKPVYGGFGIMKK